MSCLVLGLSIVAATLHKGLLAVVVGALHDAAAREPTTPKQASPKLAEATVSGELVEMHARAIEVHSHLESCVVREVPTQQMRHTKHWARMDRRQIVKYVLAQTRHAFYNEQGSTDFICASSSDFVTAGLMQMLDAPLKLQVLVGQRHCKVPKCCACSYRLNALKSTISIVRSCMCCRYGLSC